MKTAAKTNLKSGACLQGVNFGLRELDRLRPESIGVFCFADVRPLRGAAAHLDWRVCGALSRRLESGVFKGVAGESLLLATKGRLGRHRLFMFGLGSVQACDSSSMRRISQAAYDVMVGAGVDKIIFAAPGSQKDLNLEQTFLAVVRETLADRVDTILVG